MCDTVYYHKYYPVRYDLPNAPGYFKNPEDHPYMRIDPYPWPLAIGTPLYNQSQTQCQGGYTFQTSTHQCCDIWNNCIGAQQKQK